ncbi:glycine cleavage system aminomethyltransferase GcvT [Ornithinibacillus sp. 179-J 7C1 HS]|uniref:glycine cleavage system aminomethyltransferase GcvT n=1 Tax=Ornithinibacillus sp. 179-J 7C1 HS TaxID=3142384 RepID=UPI00399F5D0B
MSELKRTPIFPEYEKLGAKTIDFGGWDLPVQFSSIKEEHEATRTKAGLFDVSHMGEILVTGPKAKDYLQYVTTNDVSKLVPNKAQYALMCYEDGGTVDDFLIYMLGDCEYLVVVNAANTEKDFEWMVKNNQFNEDEVTIQNVSSEFAQLALQGPKAEEILQTITNIDLSTIKFFRFEKEVYINGVQNPVLVSRTGYTGEDGFELYITSDEGPKLWNIILEAGKDKGILPIGLGARDTLRFEANLPLYGQEISAKITPIEAGLGFAVKVNKEAEFIGKAVLKDQVENGTKRKLVGIEMIDKGIPRNGYEVLHGNEVIGFVTSGTQSPTLQKNIGLALVKTEFAELGEELEIQVRKRRLRANVISRKFLKQD